MPRRVMLAALAIVFLLTGAPLRARSQVQAQWLGELTVVSHTHFESVATSMGTNSEGATTDCTVVYLKTHQVSRAVLDYKFDYLRQSTLPNGVMQQIHIHVPGNVTSTFDPKFEVMYYEGQAPNGDPGYQLTHVAYSHWFLGKKTTTAGNPPVTFTEDYPIQADCKDPLLITVEHGFKAGGIPLKGSSNTRPDPGHYGTSQAELGTQTVTWDVRNGAIFKTY